MNDKQGNVPTRKSVNLDVLDDDDEHDDNQDVETGHASASTDMESRETVNSNLNDAALSVLKHGSFINGRCYAPYIEQFDMREKFSFPIPFTYKLLKDLLLFFLLEMSY